MQLQICHIGEAEGMPLFRVQYEGQSGDETRLTPPDQFPVEGYSESLSDGLRWYMEEFLKLPTGAFRGHAQAILNSLQAWGKECFSKLFDNGGKAQRWYNDARQGDLQFKIVSHSDVPTILAWPWEALEDRLNGPLALQYHMDRQLNNIDTAAPRTPKTEKQMNILYIISRPDGEEDVEFRTLVRPIIDCAKRHNYAVHIDLLRPPTFNQLRKVLEEKKGFYHIVHFDGHGGYGEQEQAASAGGVLVFEKEGNAKESFDIVGADQLGVLLRRSNIPVVTLNACRSAMLDAQAKDAYVTVAASLIKAGVRSVVAMSYNLWVKGAEAFVSAFYEKLFAEGNIAEAMRAGREEMYHSKERDSFTGRVEFQDWIVPVLYQNIAANERVLPRIAAMQEESVAEMPPLPLEAELDHFGFIGRDRAVQKLEQLIRKRPAGVLIHGIAGEGKTTLAKGFLQWLQDTNGLGNGAFWFSFEGLRSAAYIFNQLSEALGISLEYPLEQRLPVLIKILNQHKFVLVWDNFESAAGIAGTEVKEQMPEADRLMLKQFLRALYGGATKVLITSRARETWLGQDVIPLSLNGLDGEELWEYCNTVAEDLDLDLHHDEDYTALMAELGGNPLAVRAVLLRLSRSGKTTKALLTELRHSFHLLEGDETIRRIQSALDVFEKGVDPAFTPILRLAGLHEIHINTKIVDMILKQTAPDAVASRLACFTMLESAGLCRRVGDNIYKTHPALRTWLARLHPAAENEQREFVECWGTLAEHYTPKELHEQRGFFTLFRANLLRALELAQVLKMQEDNRALTQAFASYALNNRDFREAEAQYTNLAKQCMDAGNEAGVAVTYHQLGSVSEERRDFDAAEDWYKKSLAIELELGNEHGAAQTYHQLGIVAQLRRDFVVAENWYKQALEILLRLGDEHGAAQTYHQLGMVAQERRDFVAAEDWYKQSLKIKLRLDGEYGAAQTYHQLGRVAQERGAFDAAESWYRQSLEIELRLGNEYGAATTYHQLGVTAQERGAFDAAESWYKQSLEIELRLGDEHGAATTYFQLGRLAEDRGELEAAESWFRQALEIFERCNDPHNAAIAQRSLDRVAKLKGE